MLKLGDVCMAVGPRLHSAGCEPAAGGHSDIVLASINAHKRCSNTF